MITKIASFALGCKVNQYESQSIALDFSKAGYEIVDVNDFADVYIINTCTVTNLSDKKSRQIIRKVKLKNPDAIVCVLGCYAQTSPEIVAGIEGVDIVVGTKGKNDIVHLVEDYNKDNVKINAVSDIMKENLFEEINTSSNRTRCYLKIQDGCNQYCSYCIIPYARGNIRSRSFGSTIDEAGKISESGFKEIILTGIHIASYGKDLENVSLMSVIEEINKLPNLKRIRLSSLEPNLMTEEFVIKLSKLNKVCNHFHMSLQSGCDKTLKAMNRKYDTAKFLNSIEFIKKHFNDVSLTTDVIVGFPGETDEDFTLSYVFIKSVGFSKIHVFPYSPKKGTKAAVMENQIENNVKTSRAKKLNILSEQLNEKFISNFVDKNVEVLFESFDKGYYIGHTSNYLKVKVISDNDIINEILSVKIKVFEKDFLIGEVIL